MGRALRTETGDEKEQALPRPFGLTILHALDPELVGTILPLRGQVRFGRERGWDVDLALEDAKVSRHHATLSYSAKRSSYEIEDHDSKNGTFVEGERIRRRTLTPGDIIRIGDTLLQFGEPDPVPEGFVDDPRLIGRSAQLRAVLATIERVAPTSITVVVVGETGVGKELVAQRIHEQSGRTGPLVALNCGAVPATLIEATLFGHKKGAFTDAAESSPGFFATAQGGTLFLDEIGVLHPDVQPKLLRVLESHEYFPIGATTPRRSDARVIAATNAELRAEIKAGRFRRDLYARLSEHRIDVPPLRHRRADILHLYRHFLSLLAPDWRVEPSALFFEAMLTYDWPMNVRELRSVMMSVALSHRDTDLLLRSHLPPEMLEAAAKAAAPAKRPDAPSRAELEALLHEHQGNVAQVAQHLSRTRMQIYRWLAKHGLDAARYRPDGG